MKPRLVIVGLLSGAFWLVLAGLLSAPGAAAAGPRAPAAGAIITVTTALDDFTINGNCTLREAVEAANTDAAVDACPAGNGADTIRLPRTALVLTLAGGETTSGTVNSTADLDILGDVTLLPVACSGSGCTAPIIQAGPGWNHRLVQVTGPYAVTFSGVVLQGGNSTGAVGGGALLNLGADVTLLNTNIYSSAAAHGGAAIDNESGSLSLTGVTLRGNKAGSLGGGLYSLTGTVTLNNTTIATNTAFSAAGINLAGGSLVMTNGALQGNTAEHGPGGLLINSPLPVVLTGVSLRNNTALSDSAGAIVMNAGASLTVTAASILNNSSGISNNAGKLWVSGSNISDNGSQAILGTNAQTVITGSTLNGNSTAGNGGGIYVTGGTLSLSTSTVADNTSGSGGGGMYATTGAQVTVISSTFSGNTTPHVGGGLALESSSTTVAVTNSAFLSNTAGQLGGGVFADGSLVMVNSTVSGNSSDGAGGGISVGWEASLSNVTIANNTANQAGGTSSGGGGISGSQVSFFNTLIAGNQDNQPGTKAPDCAVIGMTSYGYNLI